VAELDGKVAIVTGGASYVGMAIGAALAAEGAKVVLADRDAGLGAEAVAGLGDGVAFLPTDVTDSHRPWRAPSRDLVD
jgi:NAD(P)-dependent dehydrogenase (short-subunit alcohol dehydrogenase family)